MKTKLLHLAFPTTFILFFLLPMAASAQITLGGTPSLTITHTAVDDGVQRNWDDPEAWCVTPSGQNPDPSCIPTSSGDVIHIPPTAKVKLSIGNDSGSPFRFIDIEGELLIPSYKDTELFVETIRVRSTGTFKIGNSSSYPVHPNNSVKIIFKAFPVQGSTQNFPVWDPNQKSRGLITEGDAKIRFYGNSKTHMVEIDDNSILTASQSTTTISSSSPTNWRDGENIVIPGTVFQRGAAPQITETTLQGDVGNNAGQFTVNDLDYDHKSMNDTNFKRHAVNLSRNITFSSAGAGSEGQTSIGSSCDLEQRGHIMFTGRGDVIIKNVLFKDLGRTNKFDPIDDVTVDFSANLGGVSPNSNPSNIRGRYAVHFHQNNYYNSEDMADLNSDEDFSSNGSPLYPNGVQNTRKEKFIYRLGEEIPISIIEGCVVWGTPGWGFVNHSGFVEMSKNICYDFVGSGFVTESGDEFGSFKENIAIGGSGDGEYHPLRQVYDSPTRPLPKADFGFAGDGFWFQGPMIRAIDNVAANCNGAGMIWFAMGSPEPLGSGQNHANNFIGVDRATAVVAYRGYDENGDNSDDITMANTAQFNPRYWNNGGGGINGDIKNINRVMLADLPILECNGFESYGCLAGFRLRFSNAPILAMFFNKFPKNSPPDFFGYKAKIILPTDICQHPYNDKHNANRLRQKVSNLRLWNNEIGLRAKYTTETDLDDIIIDNRLRYENSLNFYPGISCFDGVEYLDFKNTTVSGYALSAECVLDSPTPVCNFFPADFDLLNSNSANNNITDQSVSTQYNNFDVFCPTPTGVRMSNISSGANSATATIHWNKYDGSNRIGIRYQNSDETYWDYKWIDLGANNGITSATLTGLDPGKTYTYQIISGCELSLSSGDTYYLSAENSCAVYGNTTFNPDDGSTACLGTNPTSPETIGYTSKWTEDATFDTPCTNQLNTDLAYFAGTDSWAIIDTQISDWNITACKDETLNIAIIISGSNAVNSSTTLDVTWYDQNDNEIPTATTGDIFKNSSGHLIINPVSPEYYGTYRAEYQYTDSSGASCVINRFVNVTSASTLYTSCTINGSEVGSNDVVYAYLGHNSNYPNNISLQIDFGSTTVNPNDLKWNFLGNILVGDVEETLSITTTANPTSIIEGSFTLRPKHYGRYEIVYDNSSTGGSCFTIPFSIQPKGNIQKVYACGGPQYDSEWLPFPEVLSVREEKKFRLRLLAKGIGLTTDSEVYESTWHKTNNGQVVYPKEEYGNNIHTSYMVAKCSNDGQSAGTYVAIIEDDFGRETAHYFKVEIDPNATTLSDCDEECPIPRSNVPDIGTYSLTVYPNPAENQNSLNLSFRTEESSKVFSIYDMSGKVLKTQQFFTNKGENLRQLDISKLPAGMYFISDKNGLNAKFVVM